MNWSGGPWVADTSAWARASHPEVAPQWTEAARAGALVGCPVVTLELLYDAPDETAVQRVAGALAGLQEAPLSRGVTAAAIAALRDLASRGSAGWHRVPLPDVLIAAAAAERGFGVLHYDHHYDRLAEVLGFDSQWAAPAGSIP